MLNLLNAECLLGAYMDEEFLPWTEKYRPHSLTQVIGQDETINSLKAFVKARNMPNMLFAGPPGIGKTTATLALAHDLYGKHLDGNVLELNASDERGIDVVRGKIKDLGLFQIQKSVWAHPYDFQKEVELLRSFFNLTKDEMKKLALDGITKATPVIKDVVRQLMDEYMQQIQEITGAAIMEMANDEIQKMIKEQH